MKKKIIAVSFVVAFVLVLGVVLNPKEVKGDGTCTMEVEYAALEAIAESGKYDGSYSKTDTTKYQYPDGVPSDAKISNVESRSMTAGDCVNYYNNQSYRNDNGIGSSGTSCGEDGRFCTNSGSEQSGGLNDISGWMSNINSLGNGDVSAGCQEYVNNYQVDTDYTWNQITDGDANYDQYLKGNMQDGEFGMDVNSEFSTDSGNLLNGAYYKGGILTVTLEWDSSLTGGKCPDDEDVEDELKDKGTECVSQETASGSIGGCSSQGISDTIHYKASTPTFTSTDNLTDAMKLCSDYATVTWHANANISQSGYANVSLEKQKIHAGGGVGFGLSYSTSASYAWCGDSSLSEHPAIIDSKLAIIAKCPNGYSLDIANKTCYYCDEDNNCEETSYTCNTPVGVDISENDRTTADGKAKAEVETQMNGSVSAPSVTGPHSNDVNGGIVSLTSNVDGQGTAGSAYGGGSSLGFGLYTACINIYDPFDVVYDSSGCAGYRDTEGNQIRIDGGTRYYTPLKYQDNGTFRISASSGNISIVSQMKWSMGIVCDVKVEQKIYNPTPSSGGGSGSGSGGGTGTDGGGYKFIYRPIDLSTPTTTVFPNREPSSNWKNFRNTATDKGGSGAYDTLMTRNKVEYEMTLDASTIQAIKTLNSTTNYDYANLKTIYPSGMSKYLKSMNYISNAKYNELGKCNKVTTKVNNGDIKSNSLSLEGTECW